MKFSSILHSKSDTHSENCVPWEVSWQSWPGQGNKAHEVHKAVRVWGLPICSDELSLLTQRCIVTTAVAG